MSTILNTAGENKPLENICNEASGIFHIVTAEWNPEVTHALRDGARETLLAAGVHESNIRMHAVPGTVELVNIAAHVMKHSSTEAVIVIGCVIRGDTPHFDYVCQIVAQGVATLNSRGDSPVIFGVLTVNNQEQALERAGGKLGNKGSEAAAAAITMVNIHYQI